MPHELIGSLITICCGLALWALKALFGQQLSNKMYEGSEFPAMLTQFFGKLCAGDDFKRLIADAIRGEMDRLLSSPAFRLTVLDVVNGGTPEQKAIFQAFQVRFERIERDIRHETANRKQVTEALIDRMNADEEGT